jgi:hypothetical protein
LILGCQATGTEGVDKRVDVVAALMQLRGSVFDLEEAELCYGAVEEIWTEETWARRSGSVAGRDQATRGLVITGPRSFMIVNGASGGHSCTTAPALR